MARRYCPGNGLGTDELHLDDFIELGDKVRVTMGRYQNSIGEYLGIDNLERAILKLTGGETIYVPQTLLVLLNPPGKSKAHCLEIIQNVAFQFWHFGIFRQFLSY